MDPIRHRRTLAAALVAPLACALATPSRSQGALDTRPVSRVPA